MSCTVFHSCTWMESVDASQCHIDQISRVSLYLRTTLCIFVTRAACAISSPPELHQSLSSAYVLGLTDDILQETPKRSSTDLTCEKCSSVSVNRLFHLVFECSQNNIEHKWLNFNTAISRVKPVSPELLSQTDKQLLLTYLLGNTLP